MKDDNPKDFNFKFPDDSVPINFSTWAEAINKETQAPDTNISTPPEPGAKSENSTSYPDLFAAAMDLTARSANSEEVQLSLFVHESEFYSGITITKVRTG